MPLLQGRVAAGEANTQVGQSNPSDIRLDGMGAVAVSEYRGRFAELAYRGRLFRTGTIAATALSANTITTATSATGTPIIGVYNPLSSKVNLEILQASLNLYINTLTTPVGSGPLYWLVSTGNSAISTGANPYNMLTLAASGSAAKGFIGGVALTGLTNAMVVAFAAQFPNPTILTHGTVTAVQPMTSNSGVQNFDGSVIVPPGGVLGLYNLTSTTTMSASGDLLWAEVPV